MWSWLASCCILQKLMAIQTDVNSPVNSSNSSKSESSQPQADTGNGTPSPVSSASTASESAEPQAESSKSESVKPQAEPQADSSKSESAEPQADAGNGTATPVTSVSTVEDIHALLPHRYPFALVDRIIEYVPEKRAVGLKNVSFNEPHFQGHFPGRPIMPGVLIVEAMAQVGGIVLSQLPDVPRGLWVFAGIDGVRFRMPVVPGDQLIMTVELLSVKRKRIAKMKAIATVNGKKASEGELMFSLID